MKFLFYLGHPAHYHNISKVIGILADKGHQIILVARKKDVLLDLIKDVPYKTIIISKHEGSRNKFFRIFSLLKRELRMFVIAMRHKPTALIGTDMVITHTGKLLGIPSLVMNEDDAAAVPLFAKYAYKHASVILAPDCCDTSPYTHKKTGYNGYQELAYLHPDYYTPDRSKVASLSNEGEKYFVLRFAKLLAHHDRGKTGITTAIAEQVIALLLPHGKVCISSERQLEPHFEKYRLRIKPEDMHHVLAFAELYIGDSQTMAAEAAILGTPSIRFNDFVGKLSYLQELEKEYRLSFGIKTTEPEKLFEKIEELLQMQELKKTWEQRRQKMLAEKCDVAAFLVDAIERSET